MDLEMPPTPTRYPRPGAQAARPLAPVARPALSPTRPSPTKPVPPQALKILLAGVDKDARGAVEATVREALGARASSGPWSISVVSFGGKWSVTLDGPDDRLRGLSFVTDPSRLSDALRRAIDGGREGAALGVPPDVTPPSMAETRDAHVCEHCGGAVVVVYERRPGESNQIAPLACPHCWKVGHVEIGAWAAAGGDYRSEKG
jgi:hypothetical protein